MPTFPRLRRLPRLHLGLLGLTQEEKRVLRALVTGWTLRAHRTLDGEKRYRLHALDGAVRPVHSRAVERLLDRGFVQSNQKFPVATFLLTDRGQERAAQLAEQAQSPLTARRFTGKGQD